MARLYVRMQRSGEPHAPNETGVHALRSISQQCMQRSNPERAAGVVVVVACKHCVRMHVDARRRRCLAADSQTLCLKSLQASREDCGR